MERKRKQKGARRDSKAKKSRDEEGKKPQEDSGLSSEDRKMLERWQNMQRTTKPFIHPIRKHMKDLVDIQSQEMTTAQSGSLDVETPDAAPKPQVSSIRDICVCIYCLYVLTYVSCNFDTIPESQWCISH